MKKSSISNGMSAGADHHMLKNDPNFHRNRMKKPVKVAYIMSRFPELTETFVLYEMLSVEQMGIEVEVFPLLRGSTSAKTRDGASLFRKLLDLRSSGREAQLVQPEARRLVQRACYQPFLSLSILGAQIHFLRHKPKEYLSALWNLIRGTWGSLNFMLGGVSIFPKVVLFARVMESKGIHHVHAHFANHPAAAAFVIHRLTGISYSFTAHGSDLHRRKQMLRQKVAEAAFVVPISGYNKRVIEEVCGRDCSSRVEVIRCGVDRNVFFPCPNGGSMSNGAFNVLSIGKLHPVKGHIYLIDACKLLRERRMDFVCLIVGDGPDRALLQEKIAAAGLADFVHLLGPRLRTEIAEIYRGAHVLVAVDGSPGGRLAVEEALSLGRCCETLQRLTFVSVARRESERPAALRMAEDICARGREQWPHVQFEAVAGVGHASNIIVRAAEERRVDMIMIGGVHAGPLPRMFSGRVTKEVCGWAHCAVLVVTS